MDNEELSEKLPAITSRRIEEVMQANFNNLLQRHNTLEVKTDESLTFHRDIAVKVQSISDTMINKQEYYTNHNLLRDITTNNTLRIVTLETKKDNFKYLIPIFIAMGTLVVASIGLSIATISILINHVAAI